MPTFIKKPTKIEAEGNKTKIIGSKFISKVLDKWAYEHGMAVDFSKPGKPMANAMIKSFNGSFRDECLNVDWFLSIENTREKIKKLWRLLDYTSLFPQPPSRARAGQLVAEEAVQLNIYLL